MVKDYQNVSPRRFNRIFPAFAPCDCHIEDFDTLYNVRVISNDKTSLVTSVIVKCISCGSNATLDATSYHINEGDVVFFGTKKT